MLNILRGNRYISSMLVVLTLFISIQPVVNAAIVNTTDLVAQQQSAIDRDTLLKSLDRKDVQVALVAKGVDINMAKQRVAGMTDQEVVALNKKLDTLPAGGGVVGTIVFIAIVLLITDIIGWTDVYPFVRK